MTTQAPVRRRDSRYVPRSDDAIVAYTHPATGEVRRAKLSNLSVAGMAFEAERSDLEAGTILAGVRVCIGHCRLNGDFVVKNVRTLPDGGVQVGCLFYPETEQVERTLMTLISGIRLVQPD